MERGPQYADPGDAATPPDDPRAPGSAGKREPSAWPRRVMGGIIVLAIAAVMLGVFLPRERPEASREAVDQAMMGASGAAGGYAAGAAPSQPAQTSGLAGQTASSNVGGGEAGACAGCDGAGQTACPMKHLPNGHLLNPIFWAEERYYSGPDPLLPDEADVGQCPLCGGALWTTCSACQGTGRASAHPHQGAGGGMQASPGSPVDAEAVRGLIEQYMGAQQ